MDFLNSGRSIGASQIFVLLIEIAILGKIDTLISQQ